MLSLSVLAYEHVVVFKKKNDDERKIAKHAISTTNSKFKNIRKLWFHENGFSHKRVTNF
jgi:hypothetical protein